MEDRITELFFELFGAYPESVQEIAAHGSVRQYFRLKNGKKSVIATQNEDRKENMAFVDFARQLSERGVRVPKVLCADLEKGVYLQQDLGNTTLFDFIAMVSEEEKADIYNEVVRSLPAIQLAASRGFDYSNACPRKAFDRQSMQWDMNYFKYYFLKLADMAFDEELLEKDFVALQDHLLKADCSFFIFRDLQSRNIMLCGKEMFLIDFQGGRQGALQYDLATLLYDAKANLSEDLRAQLLETYMEEAEKLIPINKETFLDMFYAYVYMRILQTLGAYGYRGYFQRKKHFLQSIPYALKNLKALGGRNVLKLYLPELMRVLEVLTSSEMIEKLSSFDRKLRVTVQSFSYRKGLPYDETGNGGGFVFDCRPLPNPGREERYRSLTGKDKEVIDYLEAEPSVEEYFQSVRRMVKNSVETYLERRFANLSVWFGCTGGRHRSVYMAQRLADELQSDDRIELRLIHREQNG